MKQQIIGFICTIFFVILSATQAVFAGNKTQSIQPIILCFFSFLFVEVICLIMLIIKGELELSVIRENFKIILILNLVTASSWIGFFIAVKYIEPAIAVIIIGAIGPALVSLFSSRIRPGSEILISEKISSLCLMGIFLYIVYLIFTNKSAFHGRKELDNVIGIIAALMSSLSMSLLSIYSKKLFDKKVSVLQSISFRFFILLALCFLCMTSEDFQIIFHPNLILNIIIFAIFICLLPIYLGQIGITLLEPITVSFLMALEPAFAFSIQLFDKRLKFSHYSLFAIVLISIFIVFSLMSRVKRMNKNIKITNHQAIKS